MNTAPPVNWAILGLGKIARKFASDLQNVNGAKLLACASTNQQRADLFAGEFNVPLSFGSYEEMLQDPRIDVVYIATPHSFHFPHTLLALHHNKAVLCEKPLAINLRQATEMCNLAQAKNLFLMEAMWTRFLPHFECVSAWIEKGTLGRLRRLEADFGVDFPFDKNSRLYNPELGGGSLLDLGIYPVFAALTFLGVPDQIEAEAQFSSTGVDTRCEVQFHYSNGTSAQLMSTVLSTTETAAVLHFDKGKIVMHSRFHEPTSVSVYQDEDCIFKQDFSNNYLGYYYEAEHVTKCLQMNLKQSPLLPQAMSLSLMNVLDEIRKKIGLQYTADKLD